LMILMWLKPYISFIGAPREKTFRSPMCYELFPYPAGICTSDLPGCWADQYMKRSTMSVWNSLRTCWSTQIYQYPRLPQHSVARIRKISPGISNKLKGLVLFSTVSTILRNSSSSYPTTKPYARLPTCWLPLYFLRVKPSMGALKPASNVRVKTSQ
jgi:hypothetical protein